MFSDQQFQNEEHTADLSHIPDLELIKEAANRLQKAFRKEFGASMRYGTFRFVYHDGQLRQIEEHPRNRRHLLVSKRQLATDY